MTDAPDQFGILLSRLREDPALGNMLGLDAAALVWDLTGKLLWASPPASGLAESLVGKEGLLKAGSRARQRIEALASGLAPTQGVRLERILLDPARLSPPLTCACRLAALDSGVGVLVTILIGRVPKSKAAVVSPDASLSPPPEPKLKPPARPSGSLRFVWQTDPQTRFIHVSAGLAQAVGPVAADILGLTWEEVSRSVVDDETGEIAGLFANRQTWSGRSIQWSVDNKRGRVPVDWAGMPIFGTDRELVGFRGFGLIRREAIEDLEDAPARLSGNKASARDRGEANVLAAAAEASEIPAEARASTEDNVGSPPAILELNNAEPTETTRQGAEAPEASRPSLAEADDFADAEGGAVPAAEEDSDDTIIEIDADEWLSAQYHDQPEQRREPEVERALEAEPDIQVEPEPEVELQLEPEAHPEIQRELTEEEKLFEQLRETVAASLSEPTIEIYGREDRREPTHEPDDEPALPVAPRLSLPQPGLSHTERHAFREIARALGARMDADADLEPSSPPSQKVLPFPGPTLVPDAGAEPDEEFEDATSLEQAPVEEPQPSPDLAARGSEAETPEPFVLDDILEAPVSDEPQSEPAREGAEEDAHQTINGQFLLERLPMPALVFRGEHVIFVNPALLALAGYDDREHLAAAGGLSRLFGAGGFSASAKTLTTRRHKAVAVEVQSATVNWDGLDAELALVRRLPDTDSTQRLLSVESDLRVRESKIHELESVLDTATDGVIVLDETGRILSLNRSAEALFGYNQSDVVGDAITVLLSPESHIVALDYLEGLRSPGVASLLNDGREVFGRVRQGGSIPLFMTIGRVSDAPDRKLCAVLRDITPFKKAEGELVGARRAAEQANAQKSDLLAKISHEIRTPLNAILGFAEVMLEERFGPIGNDRYKEYLKDVHASGAHVISLVNDLLDLAKIEAGRMDLSFTSVSLNDLVSSCFTLLQPQAARDRIVMRTSFAAKLPCVVADDRSVRQIVLNLVSNAIKFTDAGGQVIVSTALTDRGEVAFRVRDTGIGMNNDEVEAALEPFRQLATSRKRGGTGLGLPLTKALVEANRGALQISSQPNEGTLVEVIFPPTRVLAE